jgi:hypothetical protein
VNGKLVVDLADIGHRRHAFDRGLAGPGVDVDFGHERAAHVHREWFAQASVDIARERTMTSKANDDEENRTPGEGSAISLHAILKIPRKSGHIAQMWSSRRGLLERAIRP